MKKFIIALSVFALLFTVPSCKKDKPSESNCPKGSVDLGMVMTREDGTTYVLYWAESNLCESGLCTNPEDYGDYYAWGETEPKSDYSWSTYQFGSSSTGPYSKYNINSSNGGVANKKVLDSEDDVAHVKLGGKWRMPTDAEWTALREQCTWKWTTQNGKTGRLVTAPNGNSIFLPAAGYQGDARLYDAGSYGAYWSSTLSTDAPYGAYKVGFFPDYVGRYDYYRCYGNSIRPVTE